MMLLGLAFPIGKLLLELAIRKGKVDSDLGSFIDELIELGPEAVADIHQLLSDHNINEPTIEDLLKLRAELRPAWHAPED